MPIDDLRSRRSPRLEGYDYATPTLYFVTFCTAYRDPILSRLVDGAVHLLSAGRRVEQMWLVALANRSSAQLLVHVIMPDHVHAILALADSVDESPSRRRQGLSSLVGTVKACSAIAINRDRHTPGARVWQRSFHDHIIRNAADLETRYRYITDNPRRAMSLQS